MAAGPPPPAFLRRGRGLFGRARRGATPCRRRAARDAWRLDGAIAYRRTRHLQAKVQYGYLEQTGHQWQGPQVVALQVGVRF